MSQKRKNIRNRVCQPALSVLFNYLGDDYISIFNICCKDECTEHDNWGRKKDERTLALILIFCSTVVHASSVSMVIFSRLIVWLICNTVYQYLVIVCFALF